MDLLRSRVPHHAYDLAARRPADDGVVDEHDAAAFDDRAHGVQLHLDPEMPYRLPRLDARPPDVMVADEPELDGKPRLLGVADRRDRPRVRDGNHHVGIGRGLAGELAPEGEARLVHVPSKNPAVRAGEVHVLEDALRGRGIREGPHRSKPVLVDDDHLARLDLAHVIGVDEIEGAALGAEHVAFADLSQDERAEAPRIADSVKRVLGQEQEGKGALDPPDRVENGVDAI